MRDRAARSPRKRRVIPISGAMATMHSSFSKISSRQLLAGRAPVGCRFWPAKMPIFQPLIAIAGRTNVFADQAFLIVTDPRSSASSSTIDLGVKSSFMLPVLIVPVAGGRDAAQRRTDVGESVLAIMPARALSRLHWRSAGRPPHLPGVTRQCQYQHHGSLQQIAMQTHLTGCVAGCRSWRARRWANIARHLCASLSGSTPVSSATRSGDRAPLRVAFISSKTVVTSTSAIGCRLDLPTALQGWVACPPRSIDSCRRRARPGVASGAPVPGALHGSTRKRLVPDEEDCCLYYRPGRCPGRDRSGAQEAVRCRSEPAAADRSARLM